MDHDEEFGTVKQACRIIGGDRPIDASTYYRGVKAGRYPAPIKVAPNIARVPLRRLRTRLREMIEAA